MDDIREARFAVREVAAVDRNAVRRTALERFSVSRMVDEYEAVYRSIAASSVPSETEPTAERPAGGLSRSRAPGQLRANPSADYLAALDSSPQRRCVL